MTDSNTRPLSLEEIVRIRMHGMTEPTDFARLAHTAREYHRLRETLKFYRDERNWFRKPEHACSAVVADTGTRARAALKESE